MNKLPKEILNYFAAFTETRFNFKRLINYKWTNDEFTLDLSFFSEFQMTLLKKIENDDLSSLIIKQDEYTVAINKDILLLEIKKLLQGDFNASYLKKCIDDEYSQIAKDNKLFIVGESGELKLAKETEKETDLLEKQKDQAQKEGIRTFNLAFRRQFEKILTEIQNKIIEQKKVELNIEKVPPSIFGASNYLNQHFEQMKKIGNNFTDSEQYITEISKYYEKSIKDIVIYDLFYNFQKYSDYIKLGTLFVFFHALESLDSAYPLYFIEVDCRAAKEEITISFPRELMLLNTPAMNSFKFDSVLTIPRATSVLKAKGHLCAIETFIQTQYGFQEPFIMEPHFANITHVNEAFPKIKNRIGFQIIINEDKKLLDYSELMTKMDLGSSSKFSDFIDQYIKGTVPNHQDEVDKNFSEKFSFKKPERYVSNSPIPVNNSQKRILLALANEKNNIIVVDGPPGTGKSHTINALTYWANENNKSVVITSHKKEALDVIDRMLTDKYKSLHPQSKPSIVRMDKESGSTNNIMNTLQSSVVCAANERVLEHNSEANEGDAKKLGARLISIIEKKIQQSSKYEDIIKKKILLEHIESELTADLSIAKIISAIVEPEPKISFEVIANFISSDHLSKLFGTSIEEYAYVVNQKKKISDILDACEKLNQVTEADQHIETALAEIPADFLSLLDSLKQHFNLEIKITELTTKHTASSWFSKILGKAPKEEELTLMLTQLTSLKFAGIVKEASRILNIEKENLTIKTLLAGIDKVKIALSLRKYKTLLSSYRALPGNQDKDVIDVHEAFRKYSEADNIINDGVYNAINTLFKCYSTLLNHIGVTEKSLDTLAILNGNDERVKKVWQWINQHYYLSENASALEISLQDIQTYYKLKQKDIEHNNDRRLKNLNNHLGIMERIKVSYEGGKRFSVDETKVLLENISCIIASPAIISKHFPMEEGLIDILIIDEASQVSIADSISLILRAKQVVIFGDEYQYGAVSATNVNAKYSASYFNEIINAYKDDYSANVSEASKKELIDEVSKDISFDDMQSDTLEKPQDGTVLWLKTFNIRTSTLTFAKAIANYTTSLREHFRSFSEIISYSNDFFYKEAQMELIVNRIRTKPIGEVIQFINVETLGLSAPNTNLDEVEAIIDDIQKRIDNKFKGSIGIITSFKEQQARLEQALNEKFNMSILKRDHKMDIWFVGDVQGEERDIVYYSFVEDKKLKNANLGSIYPVIGGAADNIRSLKMQRLNVGFSRAKDTMIFVHSQPIEQYSNTRLGDALKHYKRTLEDNKKNDFFVEDESIFESPMEKKIYGLLLETNFVKAHRQHIKIIPQFDIGKYIAAEYKTSIPKYRADFLITYASGGKEKTLILEYDGIEYHFKNPNEVNSLNFSQSYIDYDTARQMELESYGYRFLRVNKFNLRPKVQGQTEADVLNILLERKF